VIDNFDGIMPVMPVQCGCGRWVELNDTRGCHDCHDRVLRCKACAREHKDEHVDEDEEAGGDHVQGLQHVAVLPAVGVRPAGSRRRPATRRPGFVWLVLGTASDVGSVFTHWAPFEVLTLPLLIIAMLTVTADRFSARRRNPGGDQ
jgi:hypothetical protein